MPIQSNDYFQPSSTAQSYLLDDQFLQGGYKVVLDLAGLNFLLEKPDALKVGMLAYVISEKKFYQLDGSQKTRPYWDFPTFRESGFTRFEPSSVDEPVWEEAKFGGGLVEALAFPFTLEEGVLKLEESVSIPLNGKPGQILVPNTSGALEWIDVEESSGPTRGESEFICPMTLNPGDTYDFSLSMAKVIMLLEVSLSVVDLKIEGFSTSLRSSKNPYTFISHLDFMTDEGVTVEDSGDYIKHRRYSFLSNMEEPAEDKIYFRFTNVGQSPVAPTVNFKYLMLEK